MRFSANRPPSLLLAAFAAAQLTAAVDTALLVEAEDAVLGSSLGTETEDGVTYITPDTNQTGSFPDSNDTVATFSVSFPEAGDYELFARIYVGPQAASDDSFIPANNLGDAAVGSSSRWSVANGLWNVGFSNPDDIVLSVGNSGIETWKWIRVSSFADVGILTVPASQLTQTYKIATREDGLRIDKLAFGPLRVSFTVNQLENELPGTDHRQPNDDEPFQATGPILAHHTSKFLGSVWSSNADYNKDFEFYWNGMWHGNAGKWGSVEADRDVMNWTVLDEGYHFAKAHDVTFNFHVLLWGSQQPTWISSLGADEQREEILEWFEAVANRYPDIDYLQVVNEPINAPPDGENGRANYIEALGGAGDSGFDWILEAFRIARHSFPNTPLMINEYNVEGSPERSDRYLEIIETLQAEGLIDLVGFQGHAFSTLFSSSDQLQEILDKIAATGLPVMVTEMEIDGHDDFVQLAEYQRVFPIYWEHPSVIGINLSGHIGNWRYDQGAYLVNDNFSERQALQWLREYVADAGWPNFDGYLAERGLSPDYHPFDADKDGDGLATAMEYLLGRDPETVDATSAIWNAPTGIPSIALALPPERGEGLIEIQASEDLATWRTAASYHLPLRKADGLSVMDDEGGGILLSYEIDEPESPIRFNRVKFSLAD